MTFSANRESFDLSVEMFIKNKKIRMRNANLSCRLHRERLLGRRGLQMQEQHLGEPCWTRVTLWSFIVWPLIRRYSRDRSEDSRNSCN